MREHDRPCSDVRLVGTGFVLRPWRMHDLPALVRHGNDERVSGGLSERFPYPYTVGDGQRFLSGQIVDLDGPVFAIEIDAGACGGIGARRGHGERAHGAELGYWLGAQHWGKGLMTRVVGCFAPWLMTTLGLSRLHASVLDSNPASARVLLKNGFVEEGVQRAAIRKREILHDLRLFAKTDAREAGRGPGE